MTIPIRPRVWGAGLLMVAVAGLAWGVGEAVALGQRFQARQDHLRAVLARLQGWVAVEAEVTAELEKVFGPAAPINGAGTTAFGPDGATTAPLVEELSRRARAAGGRVTELKPRGPMVEVGVEGPAAALAAYLQELGAYRPPLTVDSIMLAAQPKASAPILMRVRVQVVTGPERP